MIRFGCWARYSHMSAQLLLLSCLLQSSFASSCTNGDDDGGATYEAPEPFAFLHAYDATGNVPQPHSPDPLIQYTWSSGVNTSQLQIYRVTRPVDIQVQVQVVDDDALTTGSSLLEVVTGVESFLLPEKDKNKKIRIQALPTNNNTTISLRFDWGVERAAWFEFISDDLDLSSTNVTASISEYNVPKKTMAVKKYGHHTFRLETNDELYEGVRYTWLHIHPSTNTTNSASEQKPWHILGVSLVAKVKPLNYTGYFSSSTPKLTQTWYTGAYGVRLNMEADQYNTVLVERGDRVSILGTNHPVIATSYVAFGTLQVYDFVHSELNRTNAGHVHGHPDSVVDHEIIVYPIYWTLSVNEWFWTTGNVTGFLALAPDVMSLLDDRIKDCLDFDNLKLVWMAWDDRLGDGWCNGKECGLEAHITFALMVIRACHDFGFALQVAGDAANGTQYLDTAKELAHQLRLMILNSDDEYNDYWPPNGLGVHSAANILNAGPYVAVNAREAQQLLDKYLNDSVTICSLCNFDQYWILQALGNAGNHMDHALASIQLCWGTALALGKGCFWEMYSPEWASFMKDGDQAPIGVSYCHPWAAGVSAWLSHNVGGIQPLLPGYRQVMLVPYVSPRFPSVNTTLPTPQGPIGVEAHWSNHEQQQGGGVMTVQVQTSRAGYIGFRKTLLGLLNDSGCDLDVDTVRLDDRTVTVKDLAETMLRESTDVRLALKHHFVPAVADALLFLQIPPGSHTVSARYHGACQAQDQQDRFSQSTAQSKDGAVSEGIPHFPPFPKPTYPAAVTMDRSSAGDGLSVYGSDGYMLFGFEESGEDLVRLPRYVKNVSVIHHNYYGWTHVPRSFLGESDNNATYLPDPRNKTRRALGMIGEDYQYLGRGTILDVEIDKKQLPDGQPFTVSVYSVAHPWDEKYALRVQDRKSLNLIAPTKLISNHTRGMWSSIRYSDSLRIRLVAITGAHASAIAFGEPRTKPFTIS